MKIILLPIFVSLCLLSVHAQWIPVTDDLRAAQEDLATTHKFTETAIFLSRVQISRFMDPVTMALANSHIDSFAFVRNIDSNVTDTINAVDENPQNQQCISILRNRWDLKIRRYIEYNFKSNKNKI